MAKLLKYFLLLISLFIFPPLSVQAEGVDGFDFPVGPPDGIGYCGSACTGLSFLERYDYEGDGIAEFHPGEDWNSDGSKKDWGGDNNDKGDPVYAISNGKIVYAKNGGPGWGFVVLVEHQLGLERVWSQYAHLTSINAAYLNKSNIVVNRGVELGRIGDFPMGSKKNYHLHFEIRKKYREAKDFVMNWSKEKVEEYYYNPSEFIKSHRPLAAQEITVSLTGKDSASIQWEATNHSDFLTYVLYRADRLDGDKKEIFRTSEIAICAFTDSNLAPGNYYYSLEVQTKSGQVAKSQVKEVSVAREYLKLTPDGFAQMNPFVYGDKVFWEDSRRENGNTPQKIYYYDLKTGTEKWFKIGSVIDGIRWPLWLVANSEYVVYAAIDHTGLNYNIYAYNFERGNYFPITRAPKDQFVIDISEENVVVWNDLRSGNLDIYYLDLKKAEGEQLLVSEKFNQRSPKIWGNKVVWKDSRVGNRHDLYLKEIGGEEVLLKTNAGDSAPDIWRDWAVWEYKTEIFLMDLSTKQFEKIGTGMKPSVRDGKVVFSTAEPECCRVAIYDIATKTTLNLDRVTQFYSTVSIYNNVIAFDDKEVDRLEYNIYLTFL